MILTPEHGRAFGYWRTPSGLRAACKLPPPNIHALINSQVPGSRERGGVNALALLSLRRGNGDDARTALRPSRWDADNAPVRYYAFRRWLRRLNRAPK